MMNSLSYSASGSTSVSNQIEASTQIFLGIGSECWVQVMIWLGLPAVEWASASQADEGPGFQGETGAQPDSEWVETLAAGPQIGVGMTSNCWLVVCKVLEDCAETWCMWIQWESWIQGWVGIVGWGQTLTSLVLEGRGQGIGSRANADFYCLIDLVSTGASMTKPNWLTTSTRKNIVNNNHRVFGWEGL